MKYYIGVDWGLHKSGLAVADDELRIATALKEVATKNLPDELQELKKEYDNPEIVFGYLGQVGVYQDNKSDITKIKEEMERKITDLGFKIHRAEEMFSTKLAQENLKESGRKKISRRDNAESAKIILQSWLD